MAQMLTDRELNDLSAALREQRQDLLQQIHDHLRKSDDQEQVNLADQLNDPGDYSVSDLLLDLRLEQLDRETDQLRAIEDAEARIRNGHYGICIDCGSEIRKPRLLAQPTASRCIECQDRHERTFAER